MSDLKLKVQNRPPHGRAAVSPFDQIRRERPDGEEYWTAREMMGPLGYREDKWQNMESVVERAKISCKAMGHNVSDHFTGASKMIATGKGAKRPVADVELTRYACSLVAMKKKPVSVGLIHCGPLGRRLKGSVVLLRQSGDVGKCPEGRSKRVATYGDG